MEGYPFKFWNRVETTKLKARLCWKTYPNCLEQGFLEWEKLSWFRLDPALLSWGDVWLPVVWGAQLESKHLMLLQARNKTYTCKDSGWWSCLDISPPRGNRDVLIWGNVTLGLHSGTKGRLGSLLVSFMAIWFFLISSKLASFLPTPVNCNILILSLKDSFFCAVVWIKFLFVLFKYFFFELKADPLVCFAKRSACLGFLGR